MSREHSNISLKFPDRRGTGCSKWDGIKSRFGRDDILPLWVADADYEVSDSIYSAISNRANHKIYGYTIYDDEFYDAIISWYDRRFGWKIEREWIVPAHGVVISINIAIDAYSREGDGIIIQTPIYPPFISSVKRQKRKLLDNELLYKDGEYSIDFDNLSKLSDDAKMLILCSPHNPTTKVFDREELERIAKIAIEKDLIVVSDEIHSDIVYEKRHTPTAMIEGMRDRCIVLHAPSKTFNIAGLNTSFAIIPNDSIRRKYMISHHKMGLDNGNCFGIEALKAAYSKSSEEWLDSLLEYLKENRDFVHNFIKSEIPTLHPVKTEATFLIWIDCRKLSLSDDELRDFFVNELKLGLNEGISFGSAGSGFMRLNIGCSRDILEEAMMRLKNGLDSKGLL